MKFYAAKKGYAFLWYIPVVAILAITPLIVYLSVRPVPKDIRHFWISNSNFDFFSFCKTRWFLFWSVVLLLSFLLCLCRRKEAYLSIVRGTKYFWMAWLFFIFSISLSTIFSPVPSIAWGGMFDRYEGGWVWLSYCLLLAACAFLPRQDIDFRYLTGAIIFSTSVIALIGAFQFFDMDLFRSGFGLWLILPEKSGSAEFGFLFGKGTIYSTFYNTNNGGNIAGIALPLAVCLYLFVPNFKRNGALLLGYTLLIFVLAVGCKSQAGILGLFVAFTLLIIYLARHHRIKYKRLALIFALLAPIYLGMDIYVGGPISGKFAGTFSHETLTVLPAEMNPLKVQLNHSLLMNDKKNSFFDEMVIKYGQVGGGRAYIYLRALEQRLKSRLLFGTGPDTFTIDFLQNDRYRSAGGIPDDELIDKMHSMMLQILFNTGLVSFTAFMVMLLLHLANSVRIFWKIRVQTYIEVVGLGLFLGWVGFLGSALFNESTISASPYFWAVFGASIAANHIIQFPNPLFTEDSTPDTKKKLIIRRKDRGNLKGFMRRP